MSAAPESVAGLRLRRGNPDDVADVATLVVAEERAIRGASEFGLEDARDWWRLLENRGESWIVDGRDQGIAGMLGLIGREERLEGWVAVAPEHKGGEIDRGLVVLAESRARALGQSSLLLGALADDDVLRALLDAEGFHVVRHYYRMRITFTDPPAEPVWPDGISASTFDPSEARAFHQAANEAFEDNWDFIPMEFEAWRRHRIEAPDFDPTLWFIAREGDEITGVLRCDAKRWGGGWVALLGVRRPWRRRGLGLALLRQAFVEFYRRGERSVGLGVDAQNPTGATRLYERAGMHVEAEDVIYGKDVA